MLYRVFGQLQSDPFGAFVTLGALVVALITAITIHEFSHALSATRLGDYTPRSQGRLSLRPTDHLDPLGTMMLLFAGFGWGKPVQVNAAYLRPSPRSGMAGGSHWRGPAVERPSRRPIFAVPIRTGIVDPRTIGGVAFRGDNSDILGYVIGAIVFWNLLLATFNLIPIAPLDGFKVALGVLPREAAIGFSRLEPYGPFILIGLIMLDYIVPGVSVLGSIIRPILDLLGTLVLGGQS